MADIMLDNEATKVIHRTGTEEGRAACSYIIMADRVEYIYLVPLGCRWCTHARCFPIVIAKDRTK